MNNPLSNIKLYSQLHMEDVESEETKRVLGIISEEATSASRVIKDLLDFSKQREFRQDRVDINKVVKKMLNTNTAI